MVKLAQWTRKQWLPNKEECGRFWHSLHRRIGSILMRQHCFLLQSLTVGWQPFTSMERRLTNFRLHWPFSAMPMGHRSSRSSILAEQGTLWHSIDRIQTRKDSVTSTTRQHGWHLCSLMSEILTLWRNCHLPYLKVHLRTWHQDVPAKSEDRSTYWQF